MRWAVLFSGSYAILHARVPGRLRLTVPGLKGNESLGRTLENALRAKPEIDTARASSYTGNLTVTYPPSLATDKVLWLIDAAVNAAPSDSAQPHEWWHEDIANVMQAFGTPQTGLSADDVDNHREKYGVNIPTEITAPSEWAILL